MSKQVDGFIEKNIDSFTRVCKEDTGTLIGLPYPFSIPSEDHFEELYYWDTYFTNVGLIASGRFEQAKNNTEDMLYLADRFGYVPNASRFGFLTRSQPPFLASSVEDIFRETGDTSWLSRAYEILKKEHEFWRSKRLSPTGLNRYYGIARESEAEYLSERYFQRTGLRPSEKSIDIARHLRLCYESGWDINPRWGFRGFDYIQVDLNSVLYASEMCMSRFSRILGNGEHELWKERAEKRAELMRKYMKTEDGYFTDYDFVNGRFSPVLSAATIYPLFAGLATAQEAEAIVKNMSRLEERYGISACERPGAEGNFQWDYPNGWAPLQYIAYKGLKNYGYDEKAEEIRKKYIELVDRVFSQTGNLWEKYNVVLGNTEVNTESEMPPMMGWSAGVYLYFRRESEQR